jgi:MFS family permease
MVAEQRGRPWPQAGSVSSALSASSTLSVCDLNTSFNSYSLWAGTFQLIYETDILKKNSASSISWILTMQLFLMFFLSQPVGMIVDMFGPRAILSVTSLLAVGGLIGLSFATEYWQIFLAQSLCFGLGAAGIFVPGLVAASQYFKKKRAFAVGIVASGSSAGKPPPQVHMLH